MIPTYKRTEIKSSNFYNKTRKMPLLFTRKINQPDDNDLASSENQGNGINIMSKQKTDELDSKPTLKDGKESTVFNKHECNVVKPTRKADVDKTDACEEDILNVVACVSKLSRKRTTTDEFEEDDFEASGIKKLKLDLNMNKSEPKNVTGDLETSTTERLTVALDNATDLNPKANSLDLIAVSTTDATGEQLPSSTTSNCGTIETSQNKTVPIRTKFEPRVTRQQNLRSLLKNLDKTAVSPKKQNTNSKRERFKILEESSQSTVPSTSPSHSCNSPLLFSSQRSSSGLGSSPKSTSSSPSQEQSSIRQYFSSTRGDLANSSQPINTKSPRRTAGSSRKCLRLGKCADASSLSSNKKAQMYLDLGQKDFGHVTCPTCNMVYTRAQPDDEADHLKFHEKLVTTLRFRGWKTERVLKRYEDGRVIVVLPRDHSTHLKKAADVRSVVDNELGFSYESSQRMQDAQTYMFITNNKIVGCVVAVEVKKAYRMIPVEETDHPIDGQGAWCCSSTSIHAQCGVSRVWVLKQNRRQGIATRLLDCARNHFIYGCVVDKDALAFSDPTPAGKLLAESYIGSKTFLVFR